MNDNQHNRRDFIKTTSLAAFGSMVASNNSVANFISLPGTTDMDINNSQSVIGNYGEWAAGLRKKSLPAFSFRRDEFRDVNSWRSTAKKQFAARLAAPQRPKTPEVTIEKQYEFDGLHIEELSWQLPYGNRTKAILLKPANSKGKLPAILAFHDHGGNKYLGYRKIVKTSNTLAPIVVEHQNESYSGKAWANEIARRGFVVLVADAFSFASRRVMLKDVPERLRNNLVDEEHDDPKNVEAYNQWASDHEHILAKSLFCAGTTWPGVFLSEDQSALDVLEARSDVNKEKIGCGGLSGGGLRTVMSGGMDERIKCAVCVGFMSTWDDFLLNKSFTHTWMTYVPLTPNELEFPEILGLRVPMPTLVLNNNEDQLYTLPEMKKADEILAAVYQKAGASDHYKASYYSGVHKFDSEMQQEAFAWFEKWLK